jgi:hypothetical protein
MTMILKVRIEPIPGIFLSEGTPPTIYCRKLVFLPSGEKMAKKLLYGACHLDLFRFLKAKWQKKAKPTVNSMRVLYFVNWATKCSEEKGIYYYLLNFEYKTLSNKMKR